MGINKTIDPNVADNPPYSRIFVIFNRVDPLTENELRESFTRFGEIEGIHIVTDKTTEIPKGFAYIKFSKMSEAMLAVEEMNGEKVGSHKGALTVRVAKNLAYGKNADEIELIHLRRLFLTVPMGTEEKEIRDIFSAFGEIVGFTMFKPKIQSDSRGHLVYVTYKKASSAAKALEETGEHDSFNVVIARPRPLRSRESTDNTEIPGSDSCVYVTCSSKLTSNHITRLFNIALGFKNARFVSGRGSLSQYVITYESPLAAEYAVRKYNGLEYPLGEHIMVKPYVKNTSGLVSHSAGKRDCSGNPVINPAIKTCLIPVSLPPLLTVVPSSPYNVCNGKRNTPSSPSHLAGKRECNENPVMNNTTNKTPLLSIESLVRSPVCSVPLPPLKSMLPKSAYQEGIGKRLFFIFHPNVPPLSSINDIFCRFGNYCGSYIVSSRHYGYAYFSCPHSAHNALKALNETHVNNMRMTVLIAEPKPASNEPKEPEELNIAEPRPADNEQKELEEMNELIEPEVVQN